MVLILVAGLLAAGCGGSAGDDDGKTSVVAAFYPLAYAATRVAPDAVVRNLTPAGAEPHDLELSPRDVERVRSADLVLYVGRGFMPALEDTIEGRDNAFDPVGPGDDPHSWLDPDLYIGIAQAVAVELGDVSAADELVDELLALDREYRRGLADCERREIVTSHAAFGHLARAYGLRQIPLTGVSPEAEPSAADIERLVERVRESGATTVFFEPLVSPRLAETVAREAGVETAVLNPIEGLTEDELEAGEDYFSVMRSNLSALRTALGCR